MTTGLLEVERKYDLPEGAPADLPVPDLSGLPGVARVAAPQEHELAATYVDTEDLRLRAAGITLRRRTGGSDAGWHLKLPAGGDREELRSPLTDLAAGLPAELAALVRARTRRAPLRPVAELRTHRTAHRLLDERGRVLLELADDRVEGRRLLPGDAGPEPPAPLRWREWEAELVEGDRALLDAVQERLRAAGAQPAAFGSKLGRVLARPELAPPGAEGPPAPVPPGGRKALRRRPAGAVVVAHLAEQVELLQVRDAAARRDLPDAVHALRVTARRLRSALTTFRPLLDRERTDPLRARLRDLSQALGAARDVEVLTARLHARLAAEPPELVLGPVARRVDLVLTAKHRAAHDALVASLDSDQHLSLLDDLDRLVAEPPLLPAAEQPAGEVLPRLVRRAWRRLERALERARRAEGAEQEELLHQARRDAKRARYAAEAVQPLYRPARRYAERLARLQDLLGEHQDGVVAREALRELAVQAHLAGENAFTLGRLHGLEQAHARTLDWESVREHVPSRKQRRWFESE